MSLLQNSNAIQTAGGYDINNSLRFRSSASAYLNRTPASAGNRKTWTWSCWVKRGNSGANQAILDADNATGGGDEIRFNADNTFTYFINGAVTGTLTTTQVFRDPSAWYHIVLAVDTTQATAANRAKLYINGSQVTAFSTATYPTQNADTDTNTATSHRIGFTRSSQTFDGYMAESHFIDGSAKAASDFGETDTTTGVWKPKAYTGTYGTNGFYLKFSDIATTSGSNAGLGKDFSGNTNYWTTNNISVTSGTTYDAMTDSPTLTSATVANYCVLNFLDKASTVTNGNLTSSGGAAHQSVRSTIQIPTTGKWYAEAITTSATNSSLAAGFGLMLSTTSLTAATNILAGAWNIYAVGDRTINRNGTNTTFGTAFTAGDVLQIAVDSTNNQAWFGVNNVWYNSTSGTTGNPSAGTNPTVTSLPTGLFAFVSHYANTMNANFGQRPFAYTPPTGFVRLNTFNLPDSTIKKGNSYMDATTYSGNSTTPRSIANAAGFQPDLVWVKLRSSAGGDHHLVDSVRGSGANGLYNLYSNSTSAEDGTDSGSLNTFGFVSAITSTGFTLAKGTNASGFNQTNATGSTYVGWQWKAGSSTVTNTSGSISAQVRANTTTGFSVVTYTGTGANATVGHGLGIAPSMIITKTRSSAAGNWGVYHSAIGATKVLNLNLTIAAATGSAWWNNTAPTSSVFTVGTSNDVNASATTMVAYCWAEIAGFSKFGSYTGNGSTDGPFVYTGFRPKFIMIKNTTSAFGWHILDTARDTYNLATNQLFPNTNTAEGTGAWFHADLLSNGFKLKLTAGESNANGSNYIYMAFAENPFKNSNAR